MHIPPVIQLAFWGGIAWGLDRLAPGLGRDLQGQGAISAAIGLIGLGVAIAGVAEFARHRTTVNPVDLDKASAIVSTGIYRFTRNPMYLGMALLLTSLVVQLGNPLGAVTIPGFVIVMTAIQIRPEERVLSEKFGEAYDAYARRVRRWL